MVNVTASKYFQIKNILNTEIPFECTLLENALLHTVADRKK
jgi:hypothetical protein